MPCRNPHGGDHVGVILRKNDPQGRDLVDAGIGAVQPARHVVEAHLAPYDGGQVGFQTVVGHDLL